MMNGLDMLNDDEAGHTLEKAIAALPPEKGVAVGKIAMKYQVDPRDPAGLLVEAAIDVEAMSVAAGEATRAASAAAQAVQAGVASIPDQIFTGAVRASDEVKGGLVSGAKAFVDAFVDAAGKQQKTLVEISSTQQSSILDAATIGAEKIRSAAENLTSSLDKAVKAKTDEGVGEFARAAAAAGKAAATSSMLAQLSRSAMVSVMAFLFACGIGAGGLWGYLLITHRVMPAGVTVMTDPFSHKAVMTLPSGATATLPGRIPDLP